LKWLALSFLCSTLLAQGDLRFNLRHDPKSLNPLLASENASQTIEYLTGGVLIRVNRLTQQL
jgi:peptide/nickel transport system substrate-binding protein